MNTLREIKRKARMALHDAMQVAALYLLETETPGEYDETPVDIRVHTQFDALGDLKGTNFQYAERVEVSPRLVFLIEQVTPVRGAIVSVELGEAYLVDHVQPPDDKFIIAEVTRLSAVKAAGLPLPGG